MCSVSIVWKLGPLKIKRTIKRYFDLYRSRNMSMTKLTEKSIRYLVRQRKNGKCASDISQELGVTPRHVRHL